MRFIKKPGNVVYTTPASYRPITLTSYVGKTMERILAETNHNFLETTKQMDENQEGLRKQKSTGRYIARLIDSILNELRSKRKPIAMFLDYSKAFDSVWQKGLLWKIKDTGIQGRIWRTLANFLLGRIIRIKIDNFISDSFQVTLGVPQGSVLSPAFFSLYVSDMFHDCSGTNYKYADDATLLISTTPFKRALLNCRKTATY